jgi:hypothetical protein
VLSVGTPTSPRARANGSAEPRVSSWRGKLEAGEACPFEDVQPRHRDRARQLRWQLEDAQATISSPIDDDRTCDAAPVPTPHEQELRARWASAQGLLRSQLPRDTFESWLSQAFPQPVDDTTIALVLPSARHVEMCRLRLNQVIASAVRFCFGPDMAINYTTPEAV